MPQLLASLTDQPRRVLVPAVERYFQISLYLLVCTGFATLVTTGKLDILSVLGVTIALLLRGWLLLRHDNIKIPERWTSYFTIAYVPIYILDFLFVSQSFVTATVHMVLVIMVAKIFSVQRDRDYLYLATLAFMEVLAAAILTVDSVFLAAFCVFMILAVSTFVSMEMRRSAALASHAAALSPVRVTPGGLAGSRAGSRILGRLRQLNGALSVTSLVLMIMIFAATAVIFFMLPRVSAGYLGNFAPRNELVSGFTNEVNLGQIGIIQQSSQVIMHVTVQEGRADVMSLKWRGVSLDQFDGQRWSTRGSGTLGMRRTLDGGFHLTEASPTPPWMGRQPLRYRVLMEPVAISVFFVAPTAEVLFGNYRWISADNNGTIYDNDRDRQITAYEVISNLAEAPQDRLRRAVESKGSFDGRYLQLPPLDPRVPALAEQVTASERTPYDKARALERYLSTNFGYTLQLPSPVPDDPIAYFLFTRKQGHCEYFASAMAVMLRSLGIPARIVNGFRTGEYNDVTGSYIIRARDAHSWVEAYFPGAGWASFDPTPAAVRPVTTSMWNRMLLYIDAAREFWREWVINYDFSHQRTLTNNAASRTRRLIDEWRRWLRRQYNQAIERAERIRDQAKREPAKWTGRTILGLTILLFLVIARPLWRAWSRRRLMHEPGRAPATAAGLWYARMTRALAHRGWRKRPTQSPREFVRAIDDPTMRRRVESFTETYERARFGASSAEAEKLPEKFRELVQK